MVRDTFHLRVPSELEPGEYVFRVGWYDTLTQEQLSTADGSDFVPLGSFTYLIFLNRNKKTPQPKWLRREKPLNDLGAFESIRSTAKDVSNLGTEYGKDGNDYYRNENKD